MVEKKESKKKFNEPFAYSYKDFCYSMESFNPDNKAVQTYLSLFTWSFKINYTFFIGDR